MTVPESAVQAFLEAAIQLGADSSWVSQVEIGRQVFPDDEVLIPSSRNVATECKARGLADITLDGNFMLTPAGIETTEG